MLRYNSIIKSNSFNHHTNIKVHINITDANKPSRPLLHRTLSIITQTTP